MRIIERAELTGIGLVDQPSYPESLAEVRARGGGGGGRGRGTGGYRRLSTIRGKIPAGKLLQCKCQGGGCDSVLFDEGSFASIGKQDGDVLGILGSYGRAVGSRERGNVRFWHSKNGDLQVAIDIPDSAAGQEFMALNEAVPHKLRPVLDPDRSDFVREGTTNRYQRAHVRAVSVAATDADEGWPDIDLSDEPASDLAAKAAKLAGIAKRRARLWL